MQKLPSLIKGIIKKRQFQLGMRDILADYSHYFFDMDGVIWKGEEKIKGAIEALNLLKQNGKIIYFITNNSLYSPSDIVNKLNKFGFAASVSQIYTSSWVASAYLKSKYPSISKIACIGSSNLVQALQNGGYNPNKIAISSNIERKQLQKHMIPGIQAVILGFDCEINYNTLTLASFYIQQGAKFLGTNSDKATRLGDFRVPGTGASLAFISAASGFQPQIIAKPNPFILNQFFRQNDGIQRSKCLMIGDNLQTDILFGQAAQISTLFVMTGLQRQSDIVKLNIFPDFYCSYLT